MSKFLHEADDAEDATAAHHNAMTIIISNTAGFLRKQPS